MTFDPLPSDLASAIREAAARLGPFADLRYCAEVESTNDVALTLGLAGAGTGTSVLADLQHAGRGRRGRDWFSPPGAGVYLSVIVRPKAPAALALLTLAAGVAAAGSIRAVASLPVELKWPNDLVIGRPWRKLGGVLCEAAGVGAVIDTVVIGLGINLRQAAFPRDITHRATSIEVELGRQIERAPLIVALLQSVAEVIELLESGEQDRVRQAWRQFGRAGLSGAAVRWLDQAGARGGRARDIDLDGALLVDVDGRTERLIAGEVQWESLSRE